ncbi:hypothetical protein B0H12DRAFT_1240797 [Mycena haematopus]|nr:hypothetical protein B0H12DRAFT_1240797 [Mycena haematopus]
MAPPRGRGGASRGRGAARGGGAPKNAKRGADDPDFEVAAPSKRKKVVPVLEPRKLPSRASRPEKPGLPDAPRTKRTPEEIATAEREKAAANADFERRRAKAIADLAELNAEQAEAEAEEQANIIYGLDDLPSDDMEVDELVSAYDEDEAILSVTEEDFARLEEDDAYLSVPEYSDKPKAAKVKTRKIKKPVKGETRAAIEAATKVIVAGKSKAVSAEPAVKKKGVQNSNAAAASSKAGLSKTWASPRSRPKPMPVDSDAPSVEVGGLSNDDASAERPDFTARHQVVRKNQMVAIVVSDDETPSRPAEKRKGVVPRPRIRPFIKDEPATKIPALSFISKTPTIIKHESSSSSFTPTSTADVNGTPGFISSTWSTAFLPACYRALYLSHDPMALGTIGKNLKEPGKETLEILQEVLDETYPGNTWVLKWADAICSKAVSRLGERRSMVAKVVLLIVERGFQAAKYYEAIDTPIPGSRVRKTETIAADARYALQPNGPAFFKFPTPENAVKFGPGDPAYIKPTGYLESGVIIEALSQFIKSEDFGVVVTQTATGEEHDFSTLPTGLLGMLAAAVERAYDVHRTGQPVPKPPIFSSANYGTAVAGYIKSIKRFKSSRWNSIIKSCGGEITERAAEPELSGGLDGLRENMYIPSSP